MIVENQRHTTDIVAAYVRHNSVATDQISGLINAVHSTLNGLGNEVVEEPPRVPAVSVRRSVRPDRIICIECGYKGQMLKKHLQSRHGLSVAEYRSRWNLASDYPMTAPNYSERALDSPNRQDWPQTGKTGVNIRSGTDIGSDTREADSPPLRQQVR